MAGAAAALSPALDAPRPALAAAPALAGRTAKSRFLIVNADDFGMSDGVNRGVIETHVHGIVTSASLLVTGAAAETAARMAQEHPGLSVGLHVDLSAMRFKAIDNLSAVAAEVDRQFAAFQQLMGRLPTHIDSHHHVHLRVNVARLFLALGDRYGLPLRGLSPVVYIAGFYGQSPSGAAEVAHVSPSALIALLEDIGPGLFALGCHPGYFEPDVADVYRHERPIEMRTLTDARVRRAIERCGITLVSYHQYRSLIGITTAGVVDSTESR